MTAVAKTSSPSITDSRDLVPFDSFKQACCNTRVSKAWKELTENCLTGYLQLMRSSGTLHVYELSRSGAEKAPDPIQDIRDLKRRFVEVLNFSPDFAVFEDFPSVVMVARCSKILKINESPWMGFYEMHLPLLVQIRDTLRSFSDRKKIALFVEGGLRNNGGSPISGYQFGLEEPLSHLLGGALVSHSLFSHWLSHSENGTVVEKDQELLNTEYSLFNTTNFPIFLFDTETSKRLSAKAEAEYRSIYRNDMVIHLALTSFGSHQTNGTLTLGKKQEIYLQLMTKRKEKLLSMIRVIALDTTEQLVNQNALSSEDRAKIAAYLDLANGPSKDQCLESYIKPEILVNLRNRMWGNAIQLSSPLVPKDVPRVLFGGSEHITKVLKLIESSKASSPSDEKENIKN